MESIGTPEQYGVAVGVSLCDWQVKLLTRLVATRLIEMDGHQGRRDSPREVNAKELLNNPHKLNLALFGKEATE